MPDQTKKTQHPPVEGSDPKRDRESHPGDRETRQADPQPGGGRRSESEKPDSPDSRWGSGARR